MMVEIAISRKFTSEGQAFLNRPALRPLTEGIIKGAEQLAFRNIFNLYNAWGVMLPTIKIIYGTSKDLEGKAEDTHDALVSSKVRFHIAPASTVPHLVPHVLPGAPEMTYLEIETLPSRIIVFLDRIQKPSWVFNDRSDVALKLFVENLISAELYAGSYLMDTWGIIGNMEKSAYLQLGSVYIAKKDEICRTFGINDLKPLSLIREERFSAFPYVQMISEQFEVLNFLKEARATAMRWGYIRNSLNPAFKETYHMDEMGESPGLNYMLSLRKAFGTQLAWQISTNIFPTIDELYEPDRFIYRLQNSSPQKPIGNSQN